MRKRLVAAFDRFIDVRSLADDEVARLARAQGMDIAIDLGGYTKGSRMSIFAARAAPVQVSYLGFLGTMGAEFIDYLIADRTIVPPSARIATPRRSSIYRAIRPVTPGDASPSRRSRATRWVCRRKVSCSAASTTATRSRRARSTAGCGYCSGSSGVCSSCTARTRGCRGISGRKRQPAASTQIVLCSDPACRLRSTSRATVRPTSSSIRFPTTPARRPTMRCGRACPC